MYQGSGYYVDNGVAGNFFVSDAYKQLIIFLNKCYTEGLINPDVFTQDYTSFQNLARSGVVGFTFGYDILDRMLYYAVGHWNDYFSGLIYIRNENLQPLQLVLREILLIADSSSLTATSGYSNALMYVEAMRYGVIIVSSLPLLILYPFVQKYFEKGVMLGAVKG